MKNKLEKELRDERETTRRWRDFYKWVKKNSKKLKMEIKDAQTQADQMKKYNY